MGSMFADCQPGRVLTLATAEFLLPAAGAAYSVGISSSCSFPGVSLDCVIFSVR